MPTWRRAASTTSSSADSAAVCDEAIPPAASPMFDLCSRIGFGDRRARSISRRPSRIPSRYMQMISVCGSSIRNSSRSFSSTSSLLPTEAILARPRPSLVRMLRMLIAMPPLWLITEIPPGCMWRSRGTKAVERPLWRLTTPMQLGPMKRIPYSAAMSPIRSDRARPCSPNSPNPLLSMTARRIPLRPHSSRTSATVCAGVRMIARST